MTASRRSSRKAPAASRASAQRQIVLEAALVHLVEQDCRNSGKFRIGLNPRNQHAASHRDDARALPDLAVEACCVTDCFAGPLTELSGHEFRGRTCGEPARDEQQHLAAAPAFPRAALARPSSSCRRRAAQSAMRECFGVALRAGQAGHRRSAGASRHAVARSVSPRDCELGGFDECRLGLAGWKSSKPIDRAARILSVPLHRV